MDIPAIQSISILNILELRFPLFYLLIYFLRIPCMALGCILTRNPSCPSIQQPCSLVHAGLPWVPMCHLIFVGQKVPMTDVSFYATVRRWSLHLTWTCSLPTFVRFPLDSKYYYGILCSTSTSYQLYMQELRSCLWWLYGNRFSHRRREGMIMP